MLLISFPKVTVHCGDVLDYPGDVRVTMKKLVDDIISGCDVTHERNTPAGDELFETRARHRSS